MENNYFIKPEYHYFQGGGVIAGGLTTSEGSLDLQSHYFEDVLEAIIFYPTFGEIQLLPATCTSPLVD